MSWVPGYSKKLEGDGLWSLWQCDAPTCPNTHRTEEHPPLHTRRPSKHHVTYPPKGRVSIADHRPAVVHYCSDACAEPYDGAEVRDALKENYGRVTLHRNEDGTWRQQKA